MTEPLTVQVRSASLAGDGVQVFELRRAGGGLLPRFDAGAHIALHLPGALLRQYSLLNAPGECHRYVIGVHRAPRSRGGSRYLHETLRVGEQLAISAPQNNFVLNEQAPHSVLIGGGIGITPLLAMAHRLEALGRSWQLQHAVRSRAFASFGETLAAWDAAQPGRTAVHVDEENGGQVLDIPALIAAAPAGSHFYCCGPAPMLAAFEQAAQALPPEHVHVEYFQARTSPPAEACVLADAAFEVKLARSGTTLQVPAGKSMLDTLLDAGVDVPYSCGEGFCGSCRTAVLDGTPDHRDSVLSAAERACGDSVMVCCSRSRSPCLVLDL